MTNKTRENKSVKITFRISQADFAPYEKLISESNLKTSEVMREVFLAKSDKAVLPKKQSVDSKRLVFLANKASNNLNQIAHKFNLAHNKGKVTERTYTSLLNSIINIENVFIEASKKC
ncbi:MAG: hypothetical protein ACTJIB_10595 [Pseudoalteromonas prydzensis]|uniref:hypothetical protein n=1 Tax=Pseudoalteromonas prydzensis TaxID=182141 RepID=UPI003F9BCDB0